MLDFMSKIFDFKLLNMPVGGALLLAVALGVADGLGDLLTNVANMVLPGTLAPFAGMIGNVGLSFAIENWPALERFLGPDLADLVSVTSMMTAVENTAANFGVPGIAPAISGMIGKVAGLLPGPIMATPAIATAAAAPAATSGYSLGQPAEVSPTVDDVDLALLKSRGYQV